LLTLLAFFQALME